VGSRFASVTLIVFVFLSVVCAAAIANAEKSKVKQSKSELMGTWFVLVHYKDSATKNSDADRWLDKVWTFEPRGSRIYWVEYPIVVIENQDGRFESYKGNPRSRVLAKWEPSDSQLEELVDGPRVNSRGSKSKSLRGSDGKGWASTGANRVAGINVVGFHENWKIERGGENLTFKITEVMGNAARGGEEGVTAYTVERGDPSGQEMRGRFNRDGTRIGTFRMLRTKPIRNLISSEEDDSVNKRNRMKGFDALKRISDPN
jgi:hypothetical protein